MNNALLFHLQKLIAFKSISPKSDGAIEYINDLLLKNGFYSTIKVFGNNTEEKTTNLYAVYGHSKPNICFAGHVDVVPPGDEALWSCDPFSAKISTKNGKEIIYGRGVVDMKGAIACMLVATIDFLHNQPRPKGAVSFLLTSDEEGRAKYGTIKMLEYVKKLHLNQPDFVILGEPTNDQYIGDTIKIGRRGSVNFVLTIYGIQGHVAYPMEAKNPNHLAVKIMQDLIDYEFDSGNQYFQSSNLEITSIDVGNDSTNVIPRKIVIKFNVRFNSEHSGDYISQIVKTLINRYTNHYELISNISAESFIQQPSQLMQDFSKIVYNTTGSQPCFKTTGGTSDARFIYKHYPVVEFGLLNTMAHKIDEYTEISDLQKLYNVYYNSLYSILT